MSFSERFQQLRKQRGLTQEQFAEEINLSPRTIQSWENGGHLPPMKMVVLLADYFSVSLDYLFCRTDWPNFERKDAFGLPIDGEGKEVSQVDREPAPEKTTAVMLNQEQTDALIDMINTHIASSKKDHAG